VTTPAGTATENGVVAVLPKVFLSSLVANLPMLALLLVPQLLRSRAGSETLLFVGSTLYCVLIVIALTTAPLVSAWAAPRAESWTTRTAGGTTREIRRTRGRDFWQRIGEWFLFFLLAQAAGLFVAWLMPYVWDNPAFGAPREPRWIHSYRNYAAHALTIYLFSCLSFAWFGARLRQLALAR
jgi:hypothetical protein